MFISNVSNLNDVALIESNGSILTYADLYKNVSEFRTFFDNKHLVFIIGGFPFAEQKNHKKQSCFVKKS